MSIAIISTAISDPQVNGRIESGAFMITSLSNKKLPEIYKGVMKEKSDSIEVIFAGWEKDSLYYELSPEEINVRKFV